MRASENSLFSAVVVGGGPAGAAAAITLARTGCRVLLVDTIASATFKIGESLPPAAFPLLRDLGVAPLVAAGGHLPCPGTVAAWGSDALGERDFIRELHGSGWHLDRPRFDADLRTAATAAGADVRLGCTLLGAARAASTREWQLTLASHGEEFVVRTPWLIDATGRRALIADRHGEPGRRDDALAAFAVTLPAAHATDARTHVEAVPDGWWYSALLPERQRLVAFFTDDDLPAARAATAVSGWTQLLYETRHLQRIVNHAALDAAVRVRRFPAGSVSRPTFGSDGWIAVGDASLAFDPLSSQGIFHALYTGLRGAQTVLAAARGDTTALAAWNERLRAIHAAYRRHLAQCYAAEPRWADRPFWQRRHPAAPHAAHPFRLGSPIFHAQLVTAP